MMEAFKHPVSRTLSSKDKNNKSIRSNQEGMQRKTRRTLKYDNEPDVLERPIRLVMWLILLHIYDDTKSNENLETSSTHHVCCYFMMVILYDANKNIMSSYSSSTISIQTWCRPVQCTSALLLIRSRRRSPRVVLGLRFHIHSSCAARLAAGS
jgi:hypothetical protein